MNLAQYRKRFGDLPASDYLTLMKMKEMTPELAEILVDGIEFLIGTIATMSKQKRKNVEVH
ncbi:MAG: hypothetical protein GY731_11660 [Gammaproteobacteria bacterium]|nr:hypothetical protein [Gammaproteobacteria bacterium]